MIVAVGIYGKFLLCLCESVIGGGRAVLRYALSCAYCMSLIVV